MRWGISSNKLIKVRQIEAFKYFMITGSVTSAAELLHITQPAASRLLVDLEAQLGFSLFNRSRNKMSATPEAHLFFNEVQNVFIGLDSLMKAADSIARSNTGRLRIGFLHVVENFITDVVIEFLAAHPNVCLELEPGNRVDLEEMVKSSKLDLAITAEPTFDDPSLSINTIGIHRAYVAMHKTNPLANRQSLNTTDLANEKFIVLGYGSPFRSKIELAFEKEQISRNIILEARSQGHIYNLVRQGIGTAILDELVHIDPSQVVLIPFEPKVTWTYAIITLKAKPNSALIDTFTQIVEEKF
ncbi:LysR family transcriptional regulator [Vibrio ponticus]|uniref:LysR family transcriptional regulator n=2 Tax=Vibrio ponticus TaxID=265668 RepID=A0A3N3DQY5_9VIBR|nr:LysR family transcriptional regulator [Vibrio ponticus]